MSFFFPLLTVSARYFSALFFFSRLGLLCTRLSFNTHSFFCDLLPFCYKAIFPLLSRVINSLKKEVAHLLEDNVCFCYVSAVWCFISMVQWAQRILYFFCFVGDAVHIFSDLSLFKSVFPHPSERLCFAVILFLNVALSVVTSTSMINFVKSFWQIITSNNPK